MSYTNDWVDDHPLETECQNGDRDQNLEEFVSCWGQVRGKPNINVPQQCWKHQKFWKIIWYLINNNPRFMKEMKIIWDVWDVYLAQNSFIQMK